VSFTFLFSSIVIWLTGLPCSGKTTIAEEFHSRFPSSVVLDGDEVRATLNADLGFSPEDRAENLRRIAEMASIVANSVDYTIVSTLSPSGAVRDRARSIVESKGHTFLEVYVKAELDTCIKRDVKGMYAAALRGDLPYFTGIGAPYSPPLYPDLICSTDHESLDQSVAKLINKVGAINPRERHALFIGRWSPFHKGHFAIMKKVHEENPNRPLMIFVRDNPGEYWSAQFRKGMVEAAMKAMNIRATVLIIPDIDTVNWGRDVGYLPRMIDVDEEMKAVSGTGIRKALASGNEEWKELVCPGVADYLLTTDWKK